MLRLKQLLTTNKDIYYYDCIAYNCKTMEELEDKMINDKLVQVYCAGGMVQYVAGKYILAFTLADEQ